MIRQSDAINIVSQLSEKHVIFSSPMTIVFGAEDGPLYDPETIQKSLYFIGKYNSQNGL